jgi:hypothetical protein
MKLLTAIRVACARAGMEQKDWVPKILEEATDGNDQRGAEGGVGSDHGEAGTDGLIRTADVRVADAEAEDYMPPEPGNGRRVCGVCGEIFESTLSPRGEVMVAALEKFSDHQTEHNPSPGQWAEAHSRIQQGKEQSKGRE